MSDPEEFQNKIDAETIKRLRKIATDRYTELVVGITPDVIEAARGSKPTSIPHSIVMGMIAEMLIPSIYGGLAKGPGPEVAESWILSTLENVRTRLEDIGVGFDYKVMTKKGKED